MTPTRAGLDKQPADVAAMFDDVARRYDALLVNPIKDGLNLVAKEGPILNRRDGVLCLSRDAGAWDELSPAALEVHPFDLEQAAGALDTALTPELVQEGLAQVGRHGFPVVEELAPA